MEQELRKVIAQDASPARALGAAAERSWRGETLAAALLGTMPELGRLNRGAVGKLAGLAPHARDSGKREGKRFCWGGRANVRTALYMPMLSAIQHNPVIPRLLSAAGWPGQAEEGGTDGMHAQDADHTERYPTGGDCLEPQIA